MTCKQLGDACDLEFQANTFEKISELSKKHGKGMFEKNDAAHLEVMKKMQELMQNPKDMKKQFEDKRKKFDSIDN